MSARISSVFPDKLGPPQERVITRYGVAKKSGKSFKVVKFRIAKTADGTPWGGFTKLLRDVRYRVFRVANLVVSEA